MSAKVFLGIGSNMGERDENIRRAIALINALPATSVVAVSSFFSSPAQGFDGAPFRNCCIKITTAIEPLRLLAFLKEIERLLGRTREGIELDRDGSRIYHDRPVDIDILLYGRRHIDLPQLKIPHPRMQERDFVMVPLREILG